MNTDIFSLQRFFETEWGYKIDRRAGVFTEKPNCLVSVIEDEFKYQEGNGVVSESHNVFSANYLNKQTLQIRIFR